MSTAITSVASKTTIGTCGAPTTKSNELDDEKSKETLNLLRKALEVERQINMEANMTLEFLENEQNNFENKENEERQKLSALNSNFSEAEKDLKDIQKSVNAAKQSESEAKLNMDKVDTKRSKMRARRKSKRSCSKYDRRGRRRRHFIYL